MLSILEFCISDFDPGMKTISNTSLAGRPAHTACNTLQNLKWPLGGPKMAPGVLKGLYP